MAEVLEPLILDFLEWLAAGPRPYQEVMEAWRTSCPRLTVWEDALDRGLIVRRPAVDGPASVALTDAGAALLRCDHRHAEGRVAS